MYQWLDRVTGLMNRPEFFREGFVIGLMLGLVLVLTGTWVALVWNRRRQAGGVLLPGEKGDLFISANALREFVARVLYEFGEASLNSVRILDTRPGLTLSLSIDVLPDTAVVPLVQEVRTRILQQAVEKAGIERPLRVDVTVRSYMAKERKIAKGTRRVGLDPQATARPYPVETAPSEEV